MNKGEETLEIRKMNKDGKSTQSIIELGEPD
jgi:hypothetical protein